MFPNAEPQIGEPPLPGLLGREVEQLPAQSLAVMAGENVELFDLEPVAEPRYGLCGAVVDLEVADGFAAVQDPGGVAARVEQLSRDGVLGERPREMRSQFGRVVFRGERFAERVHFQGSERGSALDPGLLEPVPHRPPPRSVHTTWMTARR